MAFQAKGYYDSYGSGNTQEGDLSHMFESDASSSSFKRPISDMNIASGCPQFVAHTTAFREPYVKDDAMFFKFVVYTGDLII